MLWPVEIYPFIVNVLSFKTFNFSFLGLFFSQKIVSYIGNSDSTHFPLLQEGLLLLNAGVIAFNLSLLEKMKGSLSMIVLSPPSPYYEETKLYYTLDKVHSDTHLTKRLFHSRLFHGRLELLRRIRLLLNLIFVLY